MSETKKKPRPRYAQKEKSGKVLIVTNQNYQRKHFGDNDVPNIRCLECKKFHIRKGEDGDLNSEWIKKEDAKIKELVDILIALGFTDIHGGTDRFVERNKSKKEMMELLQEVAKKNFEDDYCFICVVLSYGKDGVITCVVDSQDRNSCPKTPTPSMMLPVAELQECLKGEKCPGLLMKPKIFLLQLEPVPEDHKEGTEPSHVEEPTKQLKIPREADFLIYNCETYYAIEAWIQGLKDHVRNKIKGKEEPLEIQRLLIRMNNLVRKYFDDNDVHGEELPCVTSLLTKEVYLRRLEICTLSVAFVVVIVVYFLQFHSLLQQSPFGQFQPNPCYFRILSACFHYQSARMDAPPVLTLHSEFLDSFLFSRFRLWLGVSWAGLKLKEFYLEYNL